MAAGLPSSRTTSPSPTPLDGTPVQAAVYVAEYTWDVPHIAHAANVVADTLSRPSGHAAAGRPPSVATNVKVPSWGLRLLPCREAS
jgi:hypothetical protein